MSNKEHYRRSFDKLTPSENLEKELISMMDNNENKKTWRPKKLLTAAVAIVVVLSLAVAVSASPYWMETVRLWINGEEVDAELYTSEDGSIVVEATGEGWAEVVVGEGEVEAPDLRASYETRDGRDYLCFTDEFTGQTEELDITGQIENGAYEQTVTVLGFQCHVELTVVEEGVYSLNLTCGE